MSPPAASLRARREARQPWIEAHGHPRSESIDVPSVTPETEQPPNGSERLAAHALQRLAHAPRPAQRQKRHAAAARARRLSNCLQCRSGRAEEGKMERRTYALRFAYDGALFRGWQRQPGERTVQQALEDALAASLGRPFRLHGAARTDAGTHAEGQVASFSIRRSLSPGDLLRLPAPMGISIRSAAEARASFHARASAVAKSYRYRFAWRDGNRDRAFHLRQSIPESDRARCALDGLRP